MEGGASREIGLRGHGDVVLEPPADKRVGSGMRLDPPTEAFTVYVPMCYSMKTMRRLRQAVLVLGLLVWFAAAGSEAQTGTGSSPAGSSPPDLVLRQIHLVETRGESTLWEVWADQVEMREAEGSGLLSRVNNPVVVVLYFNEGQLRCTADRATVDLKTKDVRLDGAVVARSDQGTQLETDSVRWIAASRRLVTDRPVTISRGNLVTQGRGMDAETSLERVRIFQNITSYLQPSGTAPRTGRRGASP